MSICAIPGAPTPRQRTRSRSDERRACQLRSDHQPLPARVPAPAVLHHRHADPAGHLAATLRPALQECRRYSWLHRRIVHYLPDAGRRRHVGDALGGLERHELRCGHGARRDGPLPRDARASQRADRRRAGLPGRDGPAAIAHHPGAGLSCGGALPRRAGECRPSTCGHSAAWLGLRRALQRAGADSAQAGVADRAQRQPDTAADVPLVGLPAGEPDAGVDADGGALQSGELGRRGGTADVSRERGLAVRGCAARWTACADIGLRLALDPRLPRLPALCISSGFDLAP